VEALRGEAWRVEALRAGAPRVAAAAQVVTMVDALAVVVTLAVAATVVARDPRREAAQSVRSQTGAVASAPLRHTTGAAPAHEGSA
jgi:hypothetical protein